MYNVMASFLTQQHRGIMDCDASAVRPRGKAELAPDRADNAPHYHDFEVLVGAASRARNRNPVWYSSAVAVYLRFTAWT